eukprot:12408789-Karenia_brevis.AAC.1
MADSDQNQRTRIACPNSRMTSRIDETVAAQSHDSIQRRENQNAIGSSGSGMFHSQEHAHQCQWSIAISSI